MSSPMLRPRQAAKALNTKGNVFEGRYLKLDTQVHEGAPQEGCGFQRSKYRCSCLVFDPQF